MVRINLLPREISEKRKFESAVSIAAVVAVIIYLVLFAVFGFVQWIVSQRTAELQSHIDLAATLNAQANALQIFEEKEADLDRRQTLMLEAVKQRVDWGRVLNELSLMLPGDVWLEELTADQTTGLMLRGMAVDSETDVPDLGHKAIARTLVRLANIELLRDVWLNSSAKEMYTGTDDTESPVLLFEIACGVLSAEPTSAAGASAPSPPTESTQ